MENEKMDIESEKTWYGAINELVLNRIIEKDKEEILYLEFLKWKKEQKWRVRQRTAGNKRYNAHLICNEQVFSVSMDKHHVNHNDVVYIPTIIHRAVNHIDGDGKLEGVIG